MAEPRGKSSLEEAAVSMDAAFRKLVDARRDGKAIAASEREIVEDGESEHGNT